MLLKLLIIRFGPLAVLGMEKDKKRIKYAVWLMALVSAGLFAMALFALFKEKKGTAILYLPFLMFPQDVFYLFSLWILLRAVRQSWSNRVWKRIYILSSLSTMIGILTEKYCNPAVLDIILKILNEKI